MDAMHYYEVAPTHIARLGSNTYTYGSTRSLEVGHIVGIEVGRKKSVGVVMSIVVKPPYATKNILDVIEETPLPSELVHLASWMSGYYATHLATVLQTLLPRGIQKTRRSRRTSQKTPVRTRTNFVLNNTQKQALAQIADSDSGTVLLHGITGSGKTAVYLNAAKAMVESGKSVIVLVPEIALTPQTVDEFSAHFSNIILAHSRQTEAERHLAWKEALDSQQPTVVIGPRSALFMPVKNIGLIVIDEAHEPSFKQEQSPRYSALRAASILVKRANGKLVIGSATPSVSDYFLAKESKRPIIEMPVTARTAKPPKIEVVDMTSRQDFRRHRFLSDILLNQLEQTLASNEQALLFHNRRGSASITLCENCGWQASCPRCFVPLTLHSDNHELRCHICGHTADIPTSCPVCQYANIIHKGIGTKLIESELHKLFPDTVIGRFDGDSESDQTLDNRYADIYDGTIKLIIGTQVVAKGLDLPHLRTVGVIQADAGLSLPDFAAPERTFQLLTQVIGRVGRSDHDTTVVVQSYQPTHPAVVDGLAQDYKAFYEKTLEERRRAAFPPFVFLLKLTCTYKTEEAAIKNSRSFANHLRAVVKDVEILGPTPAFYERHGGTYRWQLVLKAKRRVNLVNVIRYLPSPHWHYELDPIGLI